MAFGAVLLVGLVSIVLAISLIARGEITKMAYLSSENLAKSAASDLQAFFSESEETVRGVARAMLAFRTAGMSRAAATDALKQFIRNTAGAASVWVGFAQDGYDEADAKNANAIGSGPQGRFAPKWSRDEGGFTLGFALESEEWGGEGAMYTDAMESGRTQFPLPHMETVAGVETPLVTICLAIMKDGMSIGVVGIDFDSAILNSQILSLKPLETGRAFLVDGDGLIIAHPDAELVGAGAADYFEDDVRDRVMAAIGEGSDFAAVHDSVIGGEPSYLVLRPIALGESGETWSLGIVVPLSTILASLSKLMLLSVLLSIAVLAIMAAALWFTVGAAMSPINTAASAIREIAQGEADLTKSLEVRRNDEIGDLMRDFNTFVAKLRDIVESLKRAQNALGGIGEELAASSHESASATSEILANIEGVRRLATRQTESVDDSSSAVEEVTRNIESLDRLIETQASGVVQASASIEQMVGNIGAVTVSTEKMVDRFTSLIAAADSGKSKQQAVDVKVREIAGQSQLLMEANQIIARISSQTNLLAMNAAIEAAHAGEAGRGFSVVADEIRKLAETAGAQSRTIGAELKKISSSIEEVVVSSHSSAEAFGIVSRSIEETGDLVREIGRAMTEQREGSRQILEALRDMNGVTAEVRSGAREMTTGNALVLDSMKRLAEVAQTIAGSMDEMAAGAGQINKAAQAVSDLAHGTQDNIQEMEAAIGRFKV
jgi:methyl-accepting chemotaxis protein